MNYDHLLQLFQDRPSDKMTQHEQYTLKLFESHLNMSPFKTEYFIDLQKNISHYRNYSLAAYL